MKRQLFLAVFAAAILSVSAQEDERVLLTINNNPATVSEFMYIYQKNQQDGVAEQSLDEYLDMFINFKLKVEAAKEAGIDTSESFKRELSQYRKQAIPKYMTDKEAEDKLVRELYSRMQHDLKVRHVAVQCPMSANDSTVNAALEKINLLRQQVTVGTPKTVGKGKKAKTVYEVADFVDVATNRSDDPSAKRTQGLVGWLTPFRFVISFENTAYNTPVGEVSEVFRTPFGFHFLRVEQVEEHKEVNAAHIMKMVPQGNDSLSAVAKQRIDSLYQIAILPDTHFGDLAIKNSDDRGSAQRGGDLGWFSRGQMVPEFEDACFSMTVPGQISEPVRSQYGWHIIQYRDQRGIAPFEQEQENIRKRLQKSEHRTTVEKAFVEKLKKEYHFNLIQPTPEHYYEAAQGCSSLTDSLFLSRIAPLNAPLFSIDTKTYTEQDFNAYLKKNNFSQYGALRLALDDKYNAFIAQTLTEKEDSMLEKKYPELKNLVTEYHDGILLFDISLKEVWDKATQDTVGLQEYFKQHRKEYTWDSPRYKGWIVYAKDKESMKAAKSIIRNANPDSIESYLKHRVNLDTMLFVRYEKGLWKKGQEPVIDKLIFKDKEAQLTTDSLFPLVELVGKTLKAPEVYQDEKGKVVSAYQDYLEQQWIARLKEKFPVVVNQEVFNSLKKE